MKKQSFNYNFSEMDLKKLGLKEIIKSDQKLFRGKYIDASYKAIVKPSNESQNLNPHFIAYQLGLISRDEMKRRS
jgi:hypothetical protein